MKDLFTTTKCLSAQQIQDYFAEQLDEQTRFSVENHLMDCELCSAAVEGFGESYDFEKDKDLDQLANRFPGSEEAEEIQLRPLRRNYLWINRIAAAAAIILLPFAAWLYWNAQTDERLFSQYFQSYESDYLAVRSGNEASIHPMLNQAMDVYRQEEYLQSIPLFESYLEEAPENTIAAFHAGLACLEAKQTSKAIQYLEIVRLNDPDYYEDASWYLALAHLELGQTSEAKAILEDMSKIQNGYYEQKVKALLEQMK